ncbi:hypothetical protein [Porphyrobacter sp. GA68]|uniref:hypothetical protein n=1 Tax=Porphyrobacter sp. GA68 TaxID=2883480 RepID=UPI001D19891F|nr:hypothetical protein [Porphyrobacter sp. GA68]
MSFSDQQPLSTGRKIGCIGLAFGLVILNGWLLAGAAMGHCAPKVDGAGCERDELIRWLMFPGFLFVSIAIMVLAGWLALKRKD